MHNDQLHIGAANSDCFTGDTDFDFDTIYTSCYKGLVAYATRYVDIEEAQNIVQDTMMWLWDNKQTIIPGKSINALLMRIVRNKALNNVKHNTVLSRVHKQIEASLREQFESPDLYMSVELAELLEKALKSLPDNLRETFILSRVERLSYKEIAERLGISVKAVDNRLSRTMRILKQELKDYLPVLLFLLSI